MRRIGSQYGEPESSRRVRDIRVSMMGSLSVLAASNSAPALYAAAVPFQACT